MACEEVIEPVSYPLRDPGEPPTLMEMIFVCNDEAERIENTEAARAKLGEKPIPERTRRAEVFRALARFIVLIEPHMPEIRSIVTKPKRRKG